MTLSAIKTGYSASELAALNVRGYPGTPRGMTDRMKAEGVKYQDVAGGGGKNGTRREYYFIDLPLALKEAIVIRASADEDFSPAGWLAGPSAIGNASQTTAPAVTGANERSMPVPQRSRGAIGPHIEKLLVRGFRAITNTEERANYTARQVAIADARLALLRVTARFAEQQDLSLYMMHQRCVDGLFPLPGALALSAAIANDRNGFAWHIEINAQGIPTAVADVAPVPARYAVWPPTATFFRWAQRYSARGWVDLVPKYKERDMRAPVWSGAFLAVMQTPQNPTVAGALARMVLPEGMHRPAERTVQRWYAEKYSKLDRQRGRNTGSAMNPHKFHHTRTSEGMLPGYEMHSDGWGTHFTAPHPHSSKFVKLEVWHSHDVVTRYVYPPSVGLSESAVVIMKSLANAIAVDGVPAIWQTDNTGSVKNGRVEYDPVGSIAARAGLTITHNRPGNSQANGMAEEFNKYLDARSKALATYQGRDMDPLTGKRVLRITQKMVAAASRDEAIALKAEAERIGRGIVFESYAQAVDWLTQIFAEYNDRPHRGLPMMNTETGRRHLSPNEMRARFIEHGTWKPAPMDVSEIADLMRMHERKKVIRGTVSVYGQRYHHAELEHLNGEWVMVAYDIQDGDRVWIKDLEGRPICEAKYYESRARRSMSYMEACLGKRADAQQKRLQRKIDDVEAQRPGALLEQLDVNVLEQTLPALEPVPAASEETNVVALSGMRRPNFDTDPEKYRWLLAHEGEQTADDARWLAYYTETDEWFDLFGVGAKRGAEEEF